MAQDPQFIHGRRDDFCSYCGQRHTDSDYPKACPHCGNMAYLSAPAVGVGLIRVNDGLLVVKRGIAPFIGEWAFPSGFKMINESWETGICREVFEETHVTVDPATIDLIGVKNATGGAVLVFGMCAPMRFNEIFRYDAETLEAKIITEPMQLCFPHHQTMLDWYFQHCHINIVSGNVGNLHADEVRGGTGRI